jgi:hypothetical protein
MSEGIGWLATGLFASSYLCRDALRLHGTRSAVEPADQG